MQIVARRTMKHRLAALLAVGMLVVAPAGPAAAQDDQAPPVRAVLFFLPTCGHCHQVINEDLPVIFEEFGGPWELQFDDTIPAEEVTYYLLSNGTLELLVVDASVGSGGEMLYGAGAAAGVPAERQGSVPLMVIGDTYLIGSVDIPAEYPRMIREALDGEGLDWPDVPGMDAALAAIPSLDPPATSTTTTAAADPSTTTVDDPATTVETSSTTTTTTEPVPTSTVDDEDDGSAVLPVAGDDDSIAERIGRDPLGNGIAIAVLVGMVVSLVAVHLLMRRGTLGGGAAWAVPVLGSIGLGVSIYLATVEVSGTTATCGPVGDCNAVQQSEYATLFGVPIGVIGIVGYVVVLCAWFVSRRRNAMVADWARLAILAVALGGTVFSVYLTFLEPFVIGATCAWCLTSAVAITLLLWVSAGPGWSAMARLRAARSRRV
jgi:uncharacterized membrane protein